MIVDQNYDTQPNQLVDRAVQDDLKSTGLDKKVVASSSGTQTQNMAAPNSTSENNQSKLSVQAVHKQPKPQKKPSSKQMSTKQGKVKK